MSDGHHEPDRAALDELLRAFGEEPDPTPAVGTATPDDERRDEARDDRDDPSGLGELVATVDLDESTDEPVSTDATSEPAEIFIVEQEPLIEPTDETEERPPPAVIRIDDYSGSVVVEPAPAATTPDPLLAGGASDPATSDDADTSEVTSEASAEPVVISIDDEDLPDPVYVEGNLERSGNRSIVFIENDDSGDTVAPDVERNARRGIEPRLRERRAAVKRAMGRKRLRWVLLVSSVVLVAVAVLAVLGSSLFAVKEDKVSIVGNVYADPAVVDAVIQDLVGTPALVADTETAEDRLEAIPWVDEARVRVEFPHTATIEIREREAMTTYQGPDLRFRVLDREGRVLDVLAGQPIAYLLLRGPDAVDLEPGQFAPRGYVAASDLAKTLTGSIRGKVEFVDVTADGSSLSLHLDDGTIVRFGAARDLLDKLVRLETVLTNNPDREPGVIDVSTSEVTL